MTATTETCATSEVVVGCPAGNWIAATVGRVPEATGAVLFCHGLGGDRRGPRDLFGELAAGVRETGWTSVAFDFRGSGESSGHAADVTLTGMVEDLRAMTAWTRSELGVTRVIAVGHSVGGVVVTQAAASGVAGLDAAVCVAADLGPYDYGVDTPVLFARDEQLFPVVFAVQRRELDLLEKLPAVPFAFVSGTDERPGVIRTADRIAELGAPVRILEGADHLLLGHRPQLVRTVQELVEAMARAVVR